jgi:polyisoprenoid-binding protein YceI
MNKRSQSACFRSTNLLRWLLNLLLWSAATASGIEHGQDRWQIDPNNSVATVSLGSGADMLQIGLARVSGQVVFEASDPSDPTVTFNVNSNEQGAEYTSMSFSQPLRDDS